MIEEIREHIIKEAVKVCIFVISAIAHTVMLISILAGFWALDSAITFFGYESTYWANFVQNYAHSIMFLTLFTISSIAFILLIIQNLDVKKPTEKSKQRFDLTFHAKNEQKVGNSNQKESINNLNNQVNIASKNDTIDNVKTTNQRKTSDSDIDRTSES
ncbi:MAG: hypothetical protein RBR63_05335 [Methanosarcina vacuolata]|jgi:hypothetical protein|nr:hypothetical protein [Methanosarcina vacuolata]